MLLTDWLLPETASVPASDLQAELVDRDNSTQTELPTIKLELLEVASVASI